MGYIITLQKATEEKLCEERMKNFCDEKYEKIVQLFLNDNDIGEVMAQEKLVSYAINILERKLNNGELPERFKTVKGKALEKELKELRG